MKTTDVVVIGAGQAGLAMSRALAVRRIDHVVIERGRIGDRWRRGSWESLRLLTPASHSALPGLAHAGMPQDAFMTAHDFTIYLDRYAATFALPVVESCETISVSRQEPGFVVRTTSGDWTSRAVVVATGACDLPHRPSPAACLPPGIEQIVPQDYISPARLPRGGVLVIGASATGLQLAEEIQGSGRPVTLAVGNHTRLPRRYRGLDIFDAMERAGILDDPASAFDDIEAVRRQPSTQLVGRDDHRDIDLGILQAQGIRVVGRLAGIDGTRVCVDDSLASTTRASHDRMIRTLERIDAALRSKGEQEDADRPDRPVLLSSEWSVIELKRAGIRTVVWATGYVRRYPWLDIPVFDRHGEIAHKGGMTAVPGLAVLGQKFMRRRRSHFIDGCGLDAADIAGLLARHLDSTAKRPGASLVRRMVMASSS